MPDPRSPQGATPPAESATDEDVARLRGTLKADKRDRELALSVCLGTLESLLARLDAAEAKNNDYFRQSMADARHHLDARKALEAERERLQTVVGAIGSERDKFKAECDALRDKARDFDRIVTAVVPPSPPGYAVVSAVDAVVGLTNSIPDDLRRRMRPLDGAANWSAVAAQAFEEFVRKNGGEVGIYATVGAIAVQHPKKRGEWVEVWVQAVPGHVGHPDHGYEYDPYLDFLPPPPKDPEQDRAYVFVTAGAKKDVQRYVDPLLVMDYEEYTGSRFDELWERLLQEIAKRA